jgi:hypothetical protein
MGAGQKGAQLSHKDERERTTFGRLAALKGGYFLWHKKKREREKDLGVVLGVV